MAMRYKPAVTVQFPSIGFFQALADRMNEQTEKYRRFGTVDLRLGVRIEADGRLTRDRFYALMFSGYWCDQVAEPERPEAYIADCTIAGPYWAWKEMFGNIEAMGAADERHTLNYLVNLDDPFRIEAQDQFEADKAYRYMYTLQLFLEESAHLQMDYAA